MNIKYFRNKYHLELIQASHNNIQLGTLVWDPLIGSPKFHHPGMPEHIYNVFLDANIVSQKEWKKGIQVLEKEPLIDAHLSNQTIELDVQISGALQNPTIDELKASFDMSKVRNFYFKDIKVRPLSNLNRMKLDTHLEEMKKYHWTHYDGSLRRLFMITELYYGSIQMIVDYDLKIQNENSIMSNNLDILNVVKVGKSLEYTFDHMNVAFAMRIEKVRSFNG